MVAWWVTQRNGHADLRRAVSGAQHRCIAVGASAVGEELGKEEGGETAAVMEVALVRHADAPWYPEAREAWNAWAPRALAATDPTKVEDMLATILPLYTAYPDHPDVREALKKRGALAVDLRAVEYGRAASTGGAISVRGSPRSGVRRWSSAVGAP
jgi:hypothetical protein